MTQEVGGIEKIEQKSYEVTQIEWRIHDFLSIAESDKAFCSPKFSNEDDSSLYFELWPVNFYLDPEDDADALSERMILYLASTSKLKYSVEYKFGFKRSNGSILNFKNGILERDSCHQMGIRTVTLSELYSRKSYLIIPGNILTVTCTLRREIAHPIQPVALEGKKSLKLIKLDRLSENFQDLFRDTETCDTTLKVKNKDFKAHRLVLIARSPVFAAAFKHDTSERQTGVITIPDCDPDSFQVFLEYLYCGRLEEMSLRDSLSLYVTSDKYDVQELKEFCVECLMQSFTVENICEIVVFADGYGEKQLFSAAQDFFMKNGFEILLTSEWKHLMKDNYHIADKLLTEFSKANLKQKDPK